MAVARLLVMFIAMYGFSFLGPFARPAAAAHRACDGSVCAEESRAAITCDAGSATMTCSQKLVVARAGADSEAPANDEAAIPRLILGLIALAVLVSLVELFLSSRRREMRVVSRRKPRS
jgi:hypothetical protein